MAFFALIHGAYHSGACWDRVTASLRERGHDAVAADLPCTDPSAGALDYANVVTSAMAGRANAIVVGHSMGGLTAPLVAAATSADLLVYLAALVPCPGMSFDQHVAGQAGPFDHYRPQTTALANEDGSASMTASRAAEIYYHDAGWEQARTAIGLLRPQHWKPMQEVTPLDHMPDTPVASIVCTQDRTIDPEWQRRTAVERLGVEPIDFEAGHCPMVSQPGALAALLERLATA